MCLVAQSFLTLCHPLNYSPQASLSMGFFRQENWSGLPCPPPEDLPDPGIEAASPAWQADSLQLSHLGSPQRKLLVRKQVLKSDLCSREPGSFQYPEYKSELDIETIWVFYTRMWWGHSCKNVSNSSKYTLNIGMNFMVCELYLHKAIRSNH